MIQHTKTTVAWYRCDFPNCVNHDRHDVEIEGEKIYQPEVPKGWERVSLNERGCDDIHLCADHAHHRDTVALFGILQQRSARPSATA